MKNFMRSRVSFAIVTFLALSGVLPLTAASGARAVAEVSGAAFGFAQCVESVDPAGNGLYLEGDTLYCGAGNSLYVFDTGDPERPRLVSRLDGIGRLRQIVARNGIVFGAARETGVWVIDARDVANVRVVTRFDTIELATGLALAGDVLFVSQRGNGVEFVDVSDYRRPAHIDIRKTPESQSVAYSDGWLYSGEWGKGVITVFDVHDMANVRDMGIVPLKGFGDGVAVHGKTLFASTGHHRKDASRSMGDNFGLGHGLELFDITIPGRPRFLSRVDFPKLFSGGQDWWTVRTSADGRTAFAADAHNGVFAVDVTGVTQPKIVGRITVATSNADGKLSTEAVSCLAVGSNVVYFTAQNYGLGVATCSLARPCSASIGGNPVNAGVRKSYATSTDSHFVSWTPKGRAQVRGAAAYGKYLYVACGAAGLWVVQEEPDGALRSVKRLSPRLCNDVSIRDGRLYSAEDMDGIAVYGLENPLLPDEIARARDFAGRGLCCAIWVVAPAGRYAIVSNRDRYYALDSETLRPAGKSFRISQSWGRYISEDVVGGRYLALHGCNIGFKWIDLGGAAPREGALSRTNTCGQADNSCAFRGDRLLRMSRGEMQFLRPGESGERQWKGVGLSNGCTGYPSWDGGNRVAITSRIGQTAAMVDVTYENNPRTVWREKLLGHPDRSFFWQGKLVIPCGYQGLLLEK